MNGFKVFLMIMVLIASTAGSAAHARTDFEIGPGPLSDSQIQTALAAARPLAEVSSQTMPFYRRRGLEGWTLTIDNPEKPQAAPEWQVIRIYRIRHVTRVAVRGIVNAVSPQGQIRWAVSSFRILMDLSPNGELIGQAESNLFSNQLSTDTHPLAH